MFWCFELEHKRIFLLDRRNDLQTLECFQSTLGLPCFGSLIAKSIDEGAYVVNLFFLTQVLLILYFNPGGPPFFCQAIVSLVDLNRLVFNMGNAGD